ncbi:MAG: heavy metal translocating P-type ATPase metal-binding domain-containing protein [Cyclobacteriaceae bacterium]|nr:heavy metal translocating P-type ATPase metal-binding domain-containing protein [Cyclobacteriaceae bacterium]MCH8514952.1 heavy metal translocating P-type ATPase metal-binding domain-containing protein [Cyclobacteriaceae bacterium]
MNTLDHTVLTKCYHCGDDCVEEKILHDEKHFCCTGCTLVYDVLQENDLGSYYQMEQSPGTTQKRSKADANRFDYLDDADIQAKLLKFSDGQMSLVHFNLPQIHCASCVWLLENLSRLDAGVIESRVDFLKKKASIRFSHDQLSLKNLVKLLSKIGYEPTLHLQDVADDQPQKVNKDIIRRFAVAGFCFGNIMLFSLPEYFDDLSFVSADFKGFFGYLNILLALPILLYSSKDYYTSAWAALSNKRLNMDVPIVLGILALFFYSVVDIVILDGAGYMDSLGGLLFFLLIGKIFQEKTYNGLSFDRDYKSYFPLSAVKLHEGRESSVAINKLQVGDQIVVKHDDLIPCDSILRTDGARIDYSFVTGEEVPVPKKKGDLIYAGARLKDQYAQLEVLKEASQGYLTELWNHHSFQNEEVDLESLSHKVSQYFTPVVLTIAFVTLAVWSLTDFSIGVKAFTSVLIIACPCALAMSTPFATGNVLRILGMHRFYLKNSGIVEKLAKVDTYVFDKTGTLTSTENAKVSYEGKELHADILEKVKGMVKSSSHPLSLRVNEHLDGISAQQPLSWDEVKGKGITASFKGGIDIQLGSASWLQATVAESKAFANTVHIALNGEYMGAFRIDSGFREGIEKLIHELQAEGADIHVLSGDQNHQRDVLRDRLGEAVSLNFEQSPMDKLKYIESLKAESKRVIMIGDGLNDAGALQVADVGIALSEKATQFTPAGDAILDASKLQALNQFIKLSRAGRKIIIGAFALSFTYNVVGLSFAVQGLLSPVVSAILMPLSSITIIAFTTVSAYAVAQRKGLMKVGNHPQTGDLKYT